MKRKVEADLTTAPAGYPQPASADVVLVRCAAGRQFEVRAVEHVESTSVEFQVEPFRQLEVLGHAHVCLPQARTDKRVPSQVAKTSQARLGKRRKVCLGERAANPAANHAPASAPAIR